MKFIRRKIGELVRESCEETAWYTDRKHTPLWLIRNRKLKFKTHFWQKVLPYIQIAWKFGLKDFHLEGGLHQFSLGKQGTIPHLSQYFVLEIDNTIGFLEELKKKGLLRMNKPVKKRMAEILSEEL